MEMSQGHLEIYDWTMYGKELEVKNFALGIPRGKRKMKWKRFESEKDGLESRGSYLERVVCRKRSLPGAAGNGETATAAPSPPL